MTRPRAILIAGPTASGKSALAVTIAKRVGGVVVNADSMQVYRDLEILTARPRARELEQVRHALYGFVAADEAYSVGRWMEDVAGVVAELRPSDQIPVIVGGTGLYFKALLEGLSPVPAIPIEVRQHWREESHRRGTGELHAILTNRDPATAAGLAPSDLQRIARALEVIDATGRGLIQWQAEAGRPVIEEAQTLRFVVSGPRKVIYCRADARFDAMLEQGGLDEARRLAELGLSREMPAMRALGVAPLIDVVAGRMALEPATARAKQDTRHYIKRQMTWLRRHMIAWNTTETEDNNKIAEHCFTLIRC